MLPQPAEHPADDFGFGAAPVRRCESLGTCKICRQVTYVDGAVTQEGPETEYCDAELIAVETAKDVISGNTRKTWECR